MVDFDSLPLPPGARSELELLWKLIRRGDLDLVETHLQGSQLPAWAADYIRQIVIPARRQVQQQEAAELNRELAKIKDARKQQAARQVAEREAAEQRQANEMHDWDLFVIQLADWHGGSPGTGPDAWEF